jgi:hypothetical protein
LCQNPTVCIRRVSAVILSNPREAMRQGTEGKGRVREISKGL